VRPEAAHDFRLQLQQARENALKDAEAFDGVIHAIERLGSFCLGSVASLGGYQCELRRVAELSPLATAIPSQWRNVHTPFNVLYNMVKDARNDALHVGASARHLTTHAIEIALILEDALKTCEEGKYVSDFMIRDPVCAQLWQPVSLIRQRMLTNSFSFLPVKDAAGQWRVISDLEIAKYLHGQSNIERKRRLATPLQQASEIKLLEAMCVSDTASIDSALMNLDGTPVLVFRDDDLVGIVTAFDLL
jgi:CBS domain-containing protein